MKLALLILVLLLAAAAAWVRLAPTDPADWHRAAPEAAPGDYPGANRFQAVRALGVAPAEALAAADAVIAASPRTARIAGSVAEGRITYVTRTALWGFPDYTTAEITPGGALSLWGRSRFGGSDWGVNEKRIRAWLAALEGRI